MPLAVPVAARLGLGTFKFKFSYYPLAAHAGNFKFKLLTKTTRPRPGQPAELKPLSANLALCHALSGTEAGRVLFRGTAFSHQGHVPCTASAISARKLLSDAR